MSSSFFRSFERRRADRRARSVPPSTLTPAAWADSTPPSPEARARAPDAASAAAAASSALACDLAAEVGASSTRALERVDRMAVALPPDSAMRHELTRLRLEISASRQAAQTAERLQRLQRQRVRQAVETIDLTKLLRDSLTQRGADIRMRGLDVGQSLQPAKVLADGALAFLLVQTLIDWAGRHAHERVDFRLEAAQDSAIARLVCRLGLPGPEVPAPITTATEWSRDLAWQLLEEIGRQMGVPVRCSQAEGELQASIELARALERGTSWASGVSATEIEGDFASTGASAPLGGTHMLVLAADHGLRRAVRDSMAPMGVLLDFAASIDEVRTFCQGGLPHALVYEERLTGPRFGELCAWLRFELPAIVLVQIGEAGAHPSGHATLATDYGPVAHVDRDAVIATLPSALLFELARTQAR